MPPPGYLPNPGIEPRSPTLQDSLLSEPSDSNGKGRPLVKMYKLILGKSSVGPI